MDKNYKSDFSIILRLKTCVKNEDGTCEKKDVGWPEHDWTARFWASSKANTYEASRKGDVLTNCFNDRGRIRIVFNDHHLGKGTLNVDFHSELPNSIYPDGKEDLYDPQPLNVELVEGQGDCATEAEVELMLPYVKITWQDLTPEQIAELKQPAVDAANETREAITEAKEATAGAITATQGAVEATDKALQATERAVTAASGAEAINNAVSDAEATRVANEAQRVVAEQIREANETKRVEAEQVRISDEDKRVSSETERITAESIREKSERQRVADETERKSAEDARVAAEAERSTAESKRETAEDGRKEAESARALAEQERETAERERSETFAGYAGEIDQAKRQVFIDLWNSRAGKYGRYNSETGMFELNGLTDIPYSEALNIYNDSFPVCFGTISGSPYNHSYPRGRTLFPIKPFGGGSIANLYAYCYMLVSISLRDGYGDGVVAVNNMANAFYGNNSLRQIITPIKYSGTISAAKDAFWNCQALETVYLAIASARETAFSFAESPKLSLESLIYMVNNKTSTYTAVITVHPKVYDRLTDESNPEWHQVMIDAADRMITFATTT